jgi:hypothetical protein
MMMSRPRAAGWAVAVAAIAAALCSALPVWRVWAAEVSSERRSFGTLWRAGGELPDDYRDADSAAELLALQWWNGLMALAFLSTCALAGRLAYRVCRRDNFEPTRLGWGLDRLAALRQQGELLKRGRARPHQPPRRRRFSSRGAPAAGPERPLSQAERGLIRWLLENGNAGSAGYLEQLDRATVAGPCPCGCPTVDLAVGGSRPSSGGDKAILADYQWCEFGDVPCGVSVFARAGLLAGLQVWSIEGGDAPSRLPDPAELRPLDSV